MILPLAAPVHLARAQPADVPAHDDWLTDAERAVLQSLRLTKRRQEWRLGRWTAKQAVHACTAAPLRGIEVLAAADGAPEVQPAGITISLSHRAERAVAVAAPSPLRLGCDLEHVEPRSERFICDYFTTAEAARVLASPPGQRALLANLCWSAKESVLKALRVGLRYDTRAVEVLLPDDVQPGPITARATGVAFTGLWYASDGCVVTVLADHPIEVRMDLATGPCPGRPGPRADRTPLRPA